MMTRKQRREMNERCRVRRDVSHVRRRFEYDFGSGLWLFNTRVFYHVYDRSDHSNWLSPVDSRRFRTRWGAVRHARALNRAYRHHHRYRSLDDTTEWLVAA